MSQTPDKPTAVLTYLDAPCDAFVILSREHGGFWKPARHGYTPDPNEAVIYTRAEAVDIVSNANRYSKKLEEIALPAEVVLSVFS